MCPCFSAKAEYAHIMDVKEEKKEVVLDTNLGKIVQNEPKPIEIPTEPIIKPQEPKNEPKKSAFTSIINAILSIFKKK